MFGSYRPEDVTILLKDVTGLAIPLEAGERALRMAQGVHYSQMLPLEHQPSPLYLQTYFNAQERFSAMTALAAARVAKQIREDKGPRAVLVSLARAGTSVGVLLKRRLEQAYGLRVPHYTVSIIKGRGIDRNAMDYLLARHRPEDLQFVDGWTGKGAIQQELDAAMADYPGVDSALAVLSDPARVAGKWGTQEDFLIPSSCLNATVSGLLSRTLLREDLIGPGDFHGAVCYEALRAQDLTYTFIDAVTALFPVGEPPEEPSGAGGRGEGVAEARAICRTFALDNLGAVKPSIGEATRALLRRVTWKLLVHSPDDQAYLGHLYQLAREKGVPVEVYPLRCYRACGLLQPPEGRGYEPDSASL